MVEYRNYPLVLKTDGVNPIGIAESSALGSFSAVNLVVSTIEAGTYLNITGSFEFTGILTVTSVGSGTPIVDNSDPNNPKFRAFSVLTDGFVDVTPHPGVDPGLVITYGPNALGPEHGGTGYTLPGGEGEIPAWTAGGQLTPRPGFTFNSDILDLPAGGQYHIGGSQIGLTNLADVNAESPNPDDVLTWDGISWKNLPPTGGTTISLPTNPDRVLISVNATSVTSDPRLTYDTGTDTLSTYSIFNVCDVCATRFNEGGQLLTDKYQPKGNYQPCDVVLDQLSNLNLNDLPDRIIYVNSSQVVCATPTPSNNTYLKYTTAGGYAWDTPTGGTGTNIPNEPGRIPYIIDATSLGSESWFNILTGTGTVNVCSVCAVGSVCATTFVEGGQSLSVKYLTKAVADTYYQPCDVILNELVNDQFLSVTRGGTGLTSLSPTGSLLYAGGITTVSLTPAPQNNKYLKWNGTAYVWDTPTGGTGTNIPNEPGRIPYIIDATSLGSESWFNILTGTGTVNVCSVCAVGSVCATTFVEGGTALESKYLKITDAATTYLDKATYTTFTGTLGDLAFLDQVNLTTTSVTGTLSVTRGGTGLTTLTADTFLIGNGTSISFIPTGSFETTAHANLTYLTKSEFTTFTGTTLGDLAYSDQVNLATTSVTGTLSVVKGGTGLTSLTPTGILYAANSTTVAQTPAPTTNNYLKWDGSQFTWDVPPVGTGVSIPNQPGRIPYIIDATSLGSESWFNILTGTGTVNVCSVCAVANVCAAIFVEGGTALDSKYLKITDAATTYLDKATYTTFTGTLGDLAFLDQVNLATTSVTGTLSVTRGGTGLTTLTADTFLVGNGTSISFIPTGSFETTAHANTTFLTKSEFTTFTGITLGELAYVDQVDLTTTSVAGTLSVVKGGTGVTTLTADTFLIGNGTSISFIPTGSFETTAHANLTYLTKSEFTTFTGTTLGDLAYSDQVNLTTTSVTGTLSVSRGGTGSTTLGAGYGILYAENGGASISQGGYFNGTTLLLSSPGQSIGSVTVYAGALEATSIDLKSQLNHNLKINLATTSVTGSLNVENGGTGQTSLTAGSFIIGNGTTAVSLIPTGSFETTSYSRTNFATIASLNSYVLTSTYSTFTGTLGELAFIDQVNLATTSVTGTLTVSRGGTGLTSLTPTGLLYAANSTTITQTPAPSTNTYLKWNGTTFAWDTPGTSLPTTPDSDKFLSSLGTDKAPYSDGGVYVWIPGADQAILLGPPDSAQPFVLKYFGGGVKWEPTTEGNFTLAPPALTAASANYFSAILVDELSSVEHWNENSYIAYAEIATLNSTTLSATTYLNLPTNYLSGLGDVQITGTPTTSSVLKWNGSYWVPAADQTGAGTTPAAGTAAGAIQLNNGSNAFDADDLFYYAAKNLYVQQGSGGQINTDTVVATDVQATQMSVDTVSLISPAAGVLLVTSSLRSPTLSATTYLNLPSGTATWNANKIQGIPVTITSDTAYDILLSNGSNSGYVNFNLLTLAGNAAAGWNAAQIQGTLVSSTPPTRNNQLLAYNTSVSQWTAGLAVSSGSGAPTGGVDGDIYIQYFASGDIPCEIGVACSDETTNLTSGTAKATFRMPYTMYLTEVRANVNTAPVGSTIIVDIHKNGSTILSTKVSIDASEKTSKTAASAAVISSSTLTDDDEITVNIDQVGSSTAGKGLKIWLIGTRA